MEPNLPRMHSKRLRRNTGFNTSPLPLIGHSPMAELRQQSNLLNTSFSLQKMSIWHCCLYATLHQQGTPFLAQRLLGRTLRSDLPQTVTTLESCTPPCNTVVAEHAHRKLQQKRAYDKHAGPPLPELSSGSHVYAKPPPTSSAKAWIPAEIVGPAGPRSYFIRTGASQIRRNRAQVQPAPPRNTDSVPSHLKAASDLPDKLRPKSGVFPTSASASVPHIPPGPAADASPRSEPLSALPMTPNAALETPIPVLPSSPPVSQPPAFSSQASPPIPTLPVHPPVKLSPEVVESFDVLLATRLISVTLFLVSGEHYPLL